MINLIGRCRIYELLYLCEKNAQTQNGAQKQLETTLVKLYTAILRFLSKCFGFYDKNAISRTYEALLNQGQLQEFLSDIGYLEERVHHDGVNCSTAQNVTAHKALLENGKNLRRILDTWQDPIMRTASSVAIIHDNLNRSEREKILIWISEIPYLRLHWTARKDRTEGTGGWILAHEQYLKWKRSSQSMILWLHGVRTY